MPRHARPTTAEGKIADVIRWLDRRGFRNIAAELREAIASLEAPTPAVVRIKRRTR